MNGYVVKRTDASGQSCLVAKGGVVYAIADAEFIPYTEQYDNRSTAVAAITRYRKASKNQDIKFEVFHGETDW